MATKRGKKSKRPPSPKKTPKTKLPRTVELTGRGSLRRFSSKAVLTLTRSEELARDQAHTPPVLKAASGGATAGTAPRGAQSDTSISPPIGALRINEAAAVFEAGAAVDFQSAVVTRAEAQSALDVIDAALLQADHLSRRLDVLREDRKFNGAATIPELTSWHVSIATDASTVLHLHFGGSQQGAEAVNLAWRVLRAIGSIIAKAFAWAAAFATMVLAQVTGDAISKMTPERWHDLGQAVTHALAALSNFF